MDPTPDDLAARFERIAERLDHPPGVMAGVLRLPILDPILDEVEGVVSAAGDDRDWIAAALSPEVVRSLERLADVLTREMLGTAAETVSRRVRVIELLRRADDGRLPPRAADDQDPFGLELRTMLESDEALRVSLGRLHPLLIRATAVAPTATWTRDARGLAASADGPSLAAATGRVIAALLRAPITSRPDLLVGGVRPINQRLARGLLWFAAVAIPAPAELLGTVGLRMGTSGRSDAVVRDAALANTCAALLGASDDPAAATGLASMRDQVTNRVVLKQVDRALEALATRTGRIVEDVVDLALPTFGLDPNGRLELEAGPARAIVALTRDAQVITSWRLADGSEVATTPESLAIDEPGAVVSVVARAASIEAAIAEERRRLEDRLGSTRGWRLQDWQQRFLDHPLAGVFGRRLIWTIDQPDGPSLAILPAPGPWIGVDEAHIDPPGEGVTVRPWHPAEAGSAAAAAWRATLASRAVGQPFPQADREVFRPDAASSAPTADRRFAGRIVDHGRLRALLRARGWAVPTLGAWDQGDEATGWRAFDDGLRAEIRYQATERVPTGERVEQARIVAVRFVRTDAPRTSPAGAAVTSVALAEVPLRSFSEALRDVSLAVVVGETPPR